MADILSVNRHVAGLTDEERAERARLAVKNFRAMQRSLTGFARSITGKKNVTIELDTGHPRTDGNKIFFRPPLELGSKLKHDRSVCEKRNDNGRLACPACRVREEVMVVIYHEISHIAFDSFAPTLEVHKTTLTERAIEEWGTKYAANIRARIDSIPAHLKNDYKSLAGVISPFLPTILNALEDARVNASMFRARPGIKVMMKAHVFGLLSEGVEQADGTYMTWKDQPLNAQVIVGTFVIGAGYEVQSDWFHPDVTVVLEDTDLMSMCREAGEARRAADVYEISFKVLARLRELGFCKNPESDPEEEEEEDDAGQDDPGTDGSDGDSEPEPDNLDDEDKGEDSEAPAQEEGDEEPEDSRRASSDDSDESVCEDSEPDDQSGSEVGDESDEQADPSSDGGGGEAEPEDEAGEMEDSGEEGSGGSSPDGSDAGAERSESGNEELDGSDSSGSSSSGDMEESEGEVSDEEADQSEEGGLDDSESEFGVEERGVSDSDPVPESSSRTGNDGESTEDSEQASTSETESDDGEAQSQNGSGESNQEGEPASSVDWASDNEGRDTSEEDASRESSEQSDGTESEEEVDTDDQAFDMYGDEGMGGVRIEDEEEEDRPDYGDADEVEAALKLIENHETPPKSLQRAIDQANDDIDQAIIQGVYFETPSSEVWGVRVHREGAPGLNDKGKPVDNAWNHKRVTEAGISEVEAGIECDLDVPESIMGKALLHTRRTFQENKASTYQNNLRSGRVNGRVLGKRAWNDDDRLFGKKRVPGKRDYFVLIGIDVSGSTVGINLALAKRAAMAQAELCQRAGVRFAVYAHTFNNRAGQPYESTDGYVLDIYEIKTAEEPWDSQRRDRLATIGPDGGNLDGHAAEFFRKRMDEVTATDKILLYYTDGRMPASNYDEELVILQREIKIFKQKNYVFLGVGIRTDSPIKHGLDTVRIDNDENLKDVVFHLEKYLAK